MATQIDLGAVVPIGKGDWNPSTTYERANIVRHNSVAWICKVATSLGVEPTENSSDWYLLVKDTSSVTSINGMRGDVTIDSVPENPSIDDNSLKIASTAWANTKISQVDSKAEEALSKTGLPLGHIYLWPFSTPPDGSIQLNGSIYSRELYSDLWNLIQTKGWYKPEAEWQSMASANNGYCPWYSDGDGSTTFRTPKFAPYQKLVLASSDAGKYYEAGLPNITGSISARGSVAWQDGRGAFYMSGESAGESVGAPGTSVYGTAAAFDASRSNTIYGKSKTVQPESHDWIVCVVAFGKATNVGSVDVANVMSAVNQTQLEINQAQSKINQVQSEIKIVLPVGSVIASAMNTTPNGYLICNGAAISRTTYAALFAVIGTMFGNGNGSTTFNLPDFRNRTLWGAGNNLGAVISAGLPNVWGALNNTVYTAGGSIATGAFYTLGTTGGIAAEGGAVIGGWHVGFSAQRCSNIYDNSNTVQPPAIAVNILIKY